MAFGDPARRALSWIWPALLLVLTVWLILRARRQLGSRVERALIYPVVALLVLAALGDGFEAMSEEAAASRGSGPGRLIDVGGHRL
ncbi:hypothetical protein GM708_02570 [Vibrio cholerae]|nr:hypothetical protein [Vibrio cholerae]